MTYSHECTNHIDVISIYNIKSVVTFISKCNIIQGTELVRPYEILDLSLKILYKPISTERI